MTNVVFKGLSAVIKMEGRKKRSRMVSVASLKPLYRRSSDLRHPIGDEFAQIASGADLGLRRRFGCGGPDVYTDRPYEGGERDGNSSLGISGKISRWGFIRLGQGDRSTRQFYSLAARHLSRIMDPKPPERGTNRQPPDRINARF